VARNSLRRRVLLSLAVALLVFFGATVAVLEWSLGASLARAREEVLQAQLMALIAVAEPVEELRSLRVPEPPDGRMLSPDSGLQAEIRDARDIAVWRSPSALGMQFGLPPGAGRGLYDRWTQAEENGPGLALSSVTIDWEFEDGGVEQFRFVVAQSLAPWHDQRRAFRLGLVGWFGLLAAATLAVLAVVLRGVLQPLGRIAREIREMETARRTQLSTEWPEELGGVAANLNALLRRERARQQRYQESLANLAHSLKTPLAAVRTLLPDGADGVDSVDGAPQHVAMIRAELSRMDQIIGWQLRRAAAGGAGGVGIAPVAVAPVARDLAATLDKVYAERGVSCELDIPETLHFRGDEGDLQEILGNLLDNAWKYGRRRVRCSVNLAAGGMLELRVDDDGAGLDPARAAEALARGARLDEKQPGQGIGLAVVNELVGAYGGEVAVERSGLGGAAVRVTLPAA
jgi:two-component system, OmpR family, sensor histidine kinase PhoQ